MYEDNTHAPADVAFAAVWASTYGLTHPVLADPGYEAHGLYFQGSQPSYAILDRTMTIQYLGRGTPLADLEAEILRHL